MAKLVTQLLRNSVYITTNKLVGEPLASVYWNKLFNSAYREEEWTNSPYDYMIWRDSFPRDNYTMFYAIHKASKQPIGLASIATYMPLHQDAMKKPLSTFGMYFVEKGSRGHGIGRMIFNQAMDACKGHNIFLYGVENLWEKYAHGKPAFNKLPEWKLRSLSAMPKDVDVGRLNLNNTGKFFSLRVCNWKDVPWNTLVEYDRKLSMGYDREKYLRASFDQPDSDSFTTVLTTSCPTRNQQIYGICRIRRCIDNHIVIGPLYADDPDLAKLLLKNSIQRLPFKKNATSFKYMVPDCNSDSVLLFKSLTNGNMSEEILHPQFTDEVVQFPMQFIFSVSEEDNALY